MMTAKQRTRLRSHEPEPNRIKAAMKLLGVTQVQVAAGVGVTQSHVSEIANGNYSSLPLDTAQKLAEYFGCSTDDLFPSRTVAA